MGRPPKHDVGPIIVVEIDGKVAAWCANEFYGDEDLVRSANTAAMSNPIVEFCQLPLRAGRFGPVAGFAALISYLPGRALLRQSCPELDAALGGDDPLPAGVVS